MKKITTYFLLLFCFLTFQSKIRAQGFYDLGTIQEIRIYFSVTNWDFLMDTAKAGQEGYLLADSVVINEKTLVNCGVKYKGNSTYSVNRVKNPLHIKLDFVENQDYKGFEDVKLGNGWSDNSMIREPLAYALLGNYMKAPRGNFAKVWINNTYYGLMNNAEEIDKKFLLKHYRTNDYVHFKCTPDIIGSNGSNLAYLGAQQSPYEPLYELKSDEGWNELIGFCDTLNNQFGSFDAIADTDRFLWMLAFNNATVNLDSYTGGFRQNYFLYRNHQGMWIPTVWDLNMCFGGFPLAGGTTAALTPTTMKTMSHTLHKTESGWPLLQKLLNHSTYSKMYFAHLRTINQEQFANGTYKLLADSLHGFVATEVSADPNSLTTPVAFQNSLTMDVNSVSGVGVSPGIYSLMDSRASYLNNVLSAAPPVISDIAWQNSENYGATATITAKVTNTIAVYLGYRYTTTDRFVRTQMYDDGLHQDGAAGDGVYGVSCVISSLHIEYYIWAENAQTGVFSPARAEYEYHVLIPSIAQASVSDIVVTELLSNNESGIRNERGKKEDWIEVFNKSNIPLGLGNLYLTKSIDDLQRWKFPKNALILPQQYVLVWADDLDTTFIDLHCNFNLASAGDTLILSNGNTVNSLVVFGTLADDIAWGRCPTVESNFKELLYATPRMVNNCITDTHEEEGNQGIRAFISPNPAGKDVVTFHADQLVRYIQVFDALGQMVFRSVETDINIVGWANGVYFLRAVTVDNEVIGRKLVKIGE